MTTSAITGESRTTTGGAAWLQRLAGNPLIRWILVLLLSLTLFGVILLIFGRNPLEAYAEIFQATLGSKYGISEVLVKVTPLLLCALAVVLPARIGLVQVGGEGQLHMGAWLATGAALAFADTLPRPVALPLVIACGFIGGGLWALLPAWLRARGWLNETISTLMLNYIAILFVSYFIFGPWRDAASANIPQTAAFADAYRFPTYFNTRVHLGLLLALGAAVAAYFVLRYTRWGYEMRAIGGNPTAAERHGLRITTYILVVMFVAGGLAGLAGTGEILAIQGRLRQGISPGYGYVGFLIAWTAAQNPLTAIGISVLMAIIALGGDTLQITQGLPYAAANILMATILFVVLGNFFRKPKR